MKKIQMHLHEEPFEKIKNGLKIVEGRIFDEKRRKISVGDEIIFVSRKTGDKISVIVTNLKKFDSFSKMFDKTKMDDWGIKKNYSKDKFLNSLKKYYSSEEENKFGVIAIFFKLK